MNGFAIDAFGATDVGRKRPHNEDQFLVAELQRANAGPLSDEGVRQLIEEVLALTKRELSR